MRGQRMSGEVIGLRGVFQPVAAEPDQNLIEEIERLLEAVRAGEIVGMAGVFLNKDKVVSYSYSGLVAGYGILGGLDCLKQRLTREVLANE
jgi:hypothetical protein